LGKEKYYPINDILNDTLYKDYVGILEKEYPQFVLGGRLACYRYFDMHQSIGQAMHKFEEQFR